MMKRFLLAAIAALPAVLAAKPMIADGDIFAFLGDSITQHGWTLHDGYLHMIDAACKANKLNITVIPAGVSGHKSDQMLARLDADVLAYKPQWVTISCGVNDVWHKNGVGLEDFKRNVTGMAERCTQAGCRVILMTATMIKEDENNDYNKRVAPYNEFIRALAKEKGYLLADVGKVMRKMVAEHRKSGSTGLLLTWDGVHMKRSGNAMLAKTILETLGFDQSEIRRGETAWEKLEKKPVRIIIDLDGTGDLVRLDYPRQHSSISSVNPTWIEKPIQRCYVQFRGKYDLPQIWKQYELSFIPHANGFVKLRLRGSETGKDEIQWVGYDKLEITGAELTNPSFEELDASGKAVGWNVAGVNMRKGGLDGKSYVEGAQNFAVEQNIKVTAGQKVTLRFFVRGGERVKR